MIGQEGLDQRGAVKRGSDHAGDRGAPLSDRRERHAMPVHRFTDRDQRETWKRGDDHRAGIPRGPDQSAKRRATEAGDPRRAIVQQRRVEARHGRPTDGGTSETVDRATTGRHDRESATDKRTKRRIRKRSAPEGRQARRRHYLNQGRGDASWRTRASLQLVIPFDETGVAGGWLQCRNRTQRACQLET